MRICRRPAGRPAWAVLCVASHTSAASCFPGQPSIQRFAGSSRRSLQTFCSAAARHRVGMRLLRAHEDGAGATRSVVMGSTRSKHCDRLALSPSPAAFVQVEHELIAGRGDRGEAVAVSPRCLSRPSLAAPAVPHAAPARAVLVRCVFTIGRVDEKRLKSMRNGSVYITFSC